MSEFVFTGEAGFGPVSAEGGGVDRVPEVVWGDVNRGVTESLCKFAP